MIDWDGIRVFLALARAGRVSTAARQLGVEHTTVSRRLAAIEEQLGAPLFYRTPAGYLLTPHGKKALASAETMERAAMAIAARTRESAGKVVGIVRVAMLEELASEWLGPQLPTFRALHPGIDLQIVVGIRQLDLGRGEADLAVRNPRPRQLGLSASRLARSHFGLYASKKLVRGRRLRVTNAASLRGLPLCVYTAEHQALQEAPWFQPVLAAATVVLTSNSSRTLLAAARASHGVAVLPRLLADTQDDLMAVSEDVAGHDLWLVTHPEFRRDPKVRATAEFLRAAAANIR
jgi:DNA-binding transcriptional LysR family regulator